MQYRQAAIAALALPAFVAATPLPLQANPFSCWADVAVVAEIEADPRGTPFCSSFLGMTASTITSVATSVVYSTTTSSSTVTFTAAPSTTTKTSFVTVTDGSALSKREVSCTDKKQSTYSAVHVVVSSVPSSTMVHASATPVSSAPARAVASSSSACARPTAFNAWNDAAVSLACRCISIPVSTITTTLHATHTAVATTVAALHITTVQASAAPVTVTQTSTVHVAATATATPSACFNQGLQYAYYPNQSGNNVDSVFSNLDPTVYRTVTPYFNGTTSTIGGITNSCTNGNITIYNSPPVSCNEFVLDHRGYLFAEQAGNYSINVSSPDDAVIVWLGADAYAGWTKSNANLYEYYNETASTYTVGLAKGSYHPIRIMFVNAELEEAFDMSITAPDGTTILAANTLTSPYFVQQSCDGVTAPAYPAWGHES